MFSLYKLVKETFIMTFFSILLIVTEKERHTCITFIFKHFVCQLCF